MLIAKDTFRLRLQARDAVKHAANLAGVAHRKIDFFDGLKDLPQVIIRPVLDPKIWRDMSRPWTKLRFFQNEPKPKLSAD